jgi:hypothetical protein
MTALLAPAAGVVVGLILGWAMTTTYALAAVSRYQQRMQRKVRYWQAETASARMEAERLGRILQAYDVRPKPESSEEH